MLHIVSRLKLESMKWREQPAIIDHFQIPSTVALPEDLEREIFEIAACCRPREISKLMLVARRVKLWIEPLLYRTITLSRANATNEQYPAHSMSKLLPILGSESHSALRAAVRNFLSSPEDGAFVLSRCSGIENLWIDGPLAHTPELLPLVAGLPDLTRFHCNITMLFSWGEIDFTHRLFERITHLELFDFYIEPEERDRWAELARLPALTHLAFYHSIFVFMALRILQTCPSLLILVLKLGLREAESVDVRPDAQVLAKDPRFVVMDRRGAWAWEKGAYTGRDFWTRAEEWVAKRRGGEVDVLAYRVGKQWQWK
ncbi:hypothetical protein B0H19DRAFT_1365379 [Mycena capillaripes]|nr:hypothetical protein B0H19DRAFT_1365379 [Mycena capillaripes]